MNPTLHLLEHIWCGMTFLFAIVWFAWEVSHVQERPNFPEDDQDEDDFNP